MNFSKGPSLSPLPWYFVCGKSTHRTCAFLSCGAFCGNYIAGLEEGRGSFPRGRKEKEEPAVPEVHRRSLGLTGWAIFPAYFWCLMAAALGRRL